MVVGVIGILPLRRGPDDRNSRSSTLTAPLSSVKTPPSEAALLYGPRFGRRTRVTQQLLPCGGLISIEREPIHAGRADDELSASRCAATPLRIGVLMSPNVHPSYFVSVCKKAVVKVLTLPARSTAANLYDTETDALSTLKAGTLPVVT